MARRTAVRLLCSILLSANIVVAQSPQPTRKSIPAIAKDSKGAVLLVVMGNDEPIATGTGFVVSKWWMVGEHYWSAAVVTNYHVIAHGKFGAVKLSDGTSLTVDGVLAADKARDLAIIRVHTPSFKKFPTLALGNSDQIEVGEDVVAIGNPLGLELSVSNGILSGVRAEEKLGGKFLQITAPISHGSSGGPLFSMAGDVIGVTSMFIEGGENLNFAIPSNDVKRLMGDHLASAKLQALPNEPDLSTPTERPSDATPPPAAKVIANERLRAFTECQMEHNPYDYQILHYPSECTHLVERDFRQWAIQLGLDQEAETLALSEASEYKRTSETQYPGSRFDYNGDWSAWLGDAAVARIEKLNSKSYAVRIAVLKDSTTLVDRYVLHFYEVTSP